MKRLAMTAMILMAVTVLKAEKIHQKINGDAAVLQNQSSAVASGAMEVKEVKDGDRTVKVARPSGKVEQWGFVSYWMGLATPAGKAILRIRIFVDDDDPAHFSVYKISATGAHEGVKPIRIPDDAKTGSFISLDISLESAENWSGLALKKTEMTANPGPWIESITVVLP